MTPKQFSQHLRKGPLAAGYLFLGNELFHRDQCRRALVQAALGETGAAGPDGLIEFDLSQRPLLELVEEACTLSLFAASRLIVGANGEAALPRKVTAAAPAAQALAEYFRHPTPGVVVLIEATRHDWGERDDKAKLERVGKFFSAVPQSVQFKRLTSKEALAACQGLARRLELDIDAEGLAELVEMLGADMGRLNSELEKLALYADGAGPISRAEMEELIPEARQRGLFEFSDALARKDRRRALDIADTLAQSGQYWPMQLNLLAGLFRHALVIKEGGTRSVQQVMRFFQQRGLRMWPARAYQALEIARRFSEAELERALVAIFEADRDLRRERPDDRLVVEQLVLALTA